MVHEWGGIASLRLMNATSPGLFIQMHIYWKCDNKRCCDRPGQCVKEGPFVCTKHQLLRWKRPCGRSWRKALGHCRAPTMPKMPRCSCSCPWPYQSCGPLSQPRGGGQNGHSKGLEVRFGDPIQVRLGMYGGVGGLQDIHSFFLWRMINLYLS